MGLDMYLSRVVNEKRVIVIQWRKVNCIHAFFERELKTEIENCEDYKISVEVLKKLQETIQLVLNDNLLASTHLPTQQGFFFGSLEYDEWYFDDLKWTKQTLDTLLKNCEEEETFIYHAWW